MGRADARMRELILFHGMIDFKPRPDTLDVLVRAILSQQLSDSAASTIKKRVNELFPAGRITPSSLYKIRHSRLRRVGVSPQKATYLKGLGKRIAQGHIDLSKLRDMDDNEVLKILDDVRGIGPWTAQMVLIFSLGRPDIMPSYDLGIQASVMRLYRLRTRPTLEQIERVSKPWRPFRTIACLYLWRDRDGQ